MSTYAIIPQEQWTGELEERFPHAPLVQNYRVLVFADAETEQLKANYTSRGIVEDLTTIEIINHMKNNDNYWVVCTITELNQVLNYFDPPIVGLHFTV